MARWFPIILLALAGLAAPFAIAVTGSFLSITPNSRHFMIVETAPDAPAIGTVMVHVEQGPWTGGGAWMEWVGSVRTNVDLDPGPYSPKERRSWEGVSYRSQVATGQSAELPPPLWVRSIALEHAGPRLAGWQAQGAALGWPRPVLYWLWDWKSRSLQGGVEATLATPTATSPGTQAPSGITGWNFRPKGVPKNALPWRIVWPGLIEDLAWSWGTLGAVWLTVRTIRRARRRRRGACLRCGYLRGGIGAEAPCPECGLQSKPPEASNEPT